MALTAGLIDNDEKLAFFQKTLNILKSRLKYKNHTQFETKMTRRRSISDQNVPLMLDIPMYPI